jgi:hypothetical protein
MAKRQSRAQFPLFGRAFRLATPTCFRYPAFCNNGAVLYERNTMKLESIRLKNFRAFRNAEMRAIPRFCVLVGANGSGKSTLFSVFGFLALPGFPGVRSQ